MTKKRAAEPWQGKEEKEEKKNNKKKEKVSKSCLPVYCNDIQ
jgi:hypothetical protein